jgi:hypothetical protein
MSRSGRPEWPGGWPVNSARKAPRHRIARSGHDSLISEPPTTPKSRFCCGPQCYPTVYASAPAARSAHLPPIFERAGIPRAVAMQLLGHRTESVYLRYNVTAAADLRVAAERLDAVQGATS